MKKINEDKFKNIDKTINKYLKAYSKYFFEFDNFDLLGENAKLLFYKLLSMDYDYYLKKNICDMLADGKDISDLSADEQITIYNLIYLIDGYFLMVFINSYPTMDEIECAFNKINKYLSNNQEKLFSDYVNMRKNFINNFISANDNSDLDFIIYDMDKQQVEYVRRLLGFEKKLNFVHLPDYSNFSLVSSEYYYNLSEDEKKFDEKIYKSVQRCDELDEMNGGISFYKKIVEIFMDYIYYEICILRTIKNDNKKDLSNLQTTSDTISLSYNELFKQQYKINSIASLDDLIILRDELDSKYIWLKRAITEVIKKYNQRIIDFNNSVIDGTVEEELEKMNTWQKMELLALRESDYNDNYVDTWELEDFLYESIDTLLESIEQDESKEARKNGFDNFDDYSINLYKSEIEDNKVVDFKNMYLLKHFKEESKWKK